MGADTENVESELYRVARAEMKTVMSDLSGPDRAEDQKKPGGDGWDDLRRKLKELEKNYNLTPRFALMRLMTARACRLSFEDDLSRETVTVRLAGRAVTFRDITPAHARALTPEETEDYVAWMLAEAYEGNVPQATEGEFAGKRIEGERLIRNAMQEKPACRLSREEAFYLGHTLHFSPAEMEFFLLRTFAFEEGFSFTEARDCIHYYVFRTDNDPDSVTALQEAYDEMAQEKRDREWAAREKALAAAATDEEKRDVTERYRRRTAADKNVGYTRSNQSRIDTLIGISDTETRDAAFLQWLTENDWLDLPSRTALSVYRMIGAIAAHLLHPPEKEKDPLADDNCLCDRIVAHLFDKDNNLRDSDEVYREQTGRRDAAVTEQDWELLAEELLDHNRNAASAELYTDNRANAWSIISVTRNGKITGAGNIRENSQRVSDLMCGKDGVQKCDLLYLLFFTLNLVWIGYEMPRDPSKRIDRINNRLSTFVELSMICLEAAELPPFYCPHPMEQALMLSIICARNDRPDKDVPAYVLNAYPLQVYSTFVECMLGKRKKTAGDKSYKKYHPRIRKAVVDYYLTLQGKGRSNRCCKLFGIDRGTLTGWVRIREAALCYQEHSARLHDKEAAIEACHRTFGKSRDTIRKWIRENQEWNDFDAFCRFFREQEAYFDSAYQNANGPAPAGKRGRRKKDKWVAEQATAACAERFHIEPATAGNWNDDRIYWQEREKIFDCYQMQLKALGDENAAAEACGQELGFLPGFVADCVEEMKNMAQIEEKLRLPPDEAERLLQTLRAARKAAARR